MDTFTDVYPVILAGYVGVGALFIVIRWLNR